MRSVPLLPLLAAMVAGIVAQRAGAGIAIPIAAAVVAAVLFFTRRWRWGFAALLAAAGWWASSAGAPRVLESLPAKDTVCRGVVENVKLKEYGLLITLRVSEMSDSAGVMRAVEPLRTQVTLPTFDSGVEIGDEVDFDGSYRYPRLETDLPMENDMVDYYYDRGISMACYAPAEKFRIVGRDNNIYFAIRRLQDKLVGAICRTHVDSRTQQLLSAVIAGDDADIDIERRDDYAAAGIAHLLALSGAHLAIIAALMATLFYPLRLAGRRKWGWALTIAGVWVFAIVTGMSPSVTRSAIMVTGVMVAMMMERPRSSLNTLCLAALIILMVTPRALFMVGFQLSFMATLGIILFSDRLSPEGLSGGHRAFVAIIAATLAATLGTLPLVAYHFHNIPLYFIPANLVAVAFLPFIIVGGILLILLSMMGFHPVWLTAPLDWSVDVLDAVAQGIASIDGGVVENVYFSAWLLLPAYAAVAAIYLAMSRRSWRYAAAAVALLGATIAAYQLSKPSYAERELYVTRDAWHTDFIYRDGERMTVLTTDAEANIAADSVALTRLYADYIGSRGVTEFAIIRDRGDRRWPEDAGVITLGSRTLRIASSPADTVAVSRHTDYALVTKWFKGDVVKEWHRFGADTLLLSNDINKRRRERYTRELTEAGLGCRNLADAPFTLSE